MNDAEKDFMKATAHSARFAVNQVVKFGTYPQTVAGDDETPIEWRILARHGNNALLMSRYGLDVQPYNEINTGILWEDCTLRAWLNDDFINRAFSAEEQTAILLTDVENSAWFGHQRKESADTQDRIFLLSYAEASKYLEIETEIFYTGGPLEIMPTAYAIEHGALHCDYKTQDGDYVSAWWLRTPDYYSSGAAYVDCNAFSEFESVDCNYLCVRPVMWVDLDLLPDDEAEAAPENGSGHSSEQRKNTATKYVKFGTYPQTSLGTDRTPIEWMVLEEDDKKALLLSRYGLDANILFGKLQCEEGEKREGINTWERSDLRRWLNDKFINHAFSAEEQKAILLTDVDNSDAQGYSEWDSHGGSNTEDSVFLLSYDEANKYLGVTHDNRENVDARVTPTAYAEIQGAASARIDGKRSGWWYLRSPGMEQSKVAYVYTDGSLGSSEDCYCYYCIRPAMWVTREALEAVVPEDEALATDDRYNSETEYVKFGTYPQTKTGDDRTPIEWQVLIPGSHNKVLLVSRYVLDALPYNESDTDAVWNNCTLRAWLNDDFIKRAFSAEEQDIILTTELKNNASETCNGDQWGVQGSGKTQDQVFLLSCREAIENLGLLTHHASKELEAELTEYAAGRDVDISKRKTKEGTYSASWWLRSPGYIRGYAEQVDSTGEEVCLERLSVAAGVRPAMWVKVQKL